MDKLKKGDWFVDGTGNIGKIIRDIGPDGYTTALMGDDAKKGKGVGHHVNVKFLKPYKQEENRAKQLIGAVQEATGEKWDFFHEYTLDKSAGLYPVGDLAYRYGYVDKSRDVGYIELELPVKGIDKDSLQGVSVKLLFTIKVDYQKDDNDKFYQTEVTIHLADMPQTYISVDTGKPVEFDSVGDKEQVHKYIKDNKADIEAAIEEFIGQAEKDKNKDGW